MGWDRQPPEEVITPVPPVPVRWVAAAGMAILACVLLFLLYASERLPQLQALNVWAVSGSPLLIWLLAFAARAHVYGRALSQQQFLEEEAQAAQQAWSSWAQRYLVVHGSCVLLPDQVTATMLVQGSPSVPPRTGLARRIAYLPAPGGDRLQAGLQQLFEALQPTLLALPREQELRVTLLNDGEPGQHEALRNAWQHNWSASMDRAQPSVVTLTGELSYQWIDQKLKTASPAFELILVLQLCGDAVYSDGLAALLLSPNGLTGTAELPVVGGLLRPMSLNVSELQNEVAMFLQTQTSARQAAGLLADSIACQPLAGKIIAAGSAHGASPSLAQQWIQEPLCGLAGPFSSWLIAALGVEMVRHQRRPLLVLSQGDPQHWIGTVTMGALA